MDRYLVAVPILALSGCAVTSSRESEPEADKISEVRITGTLIDPVELEASEAVGSYTVEEFLNALNSEMGLPQHDENAECDEVIANVMKASIEPALVEKDKIAVAVPAMGIIFNYVYEFPDSTCSERYWTK